MTVIRLRDRQVVAEAPSATSRPNRDGIVDIVLMEICVGSGLQKSWKTRYEFIGRFTTPRLSSSSCGTNWMSSSV
jgi:hypothetical protein